jgi:hypothetical protein
MPVAVREVRNLQPDTWYQDLEIEIKNVSKKSIYFILAYLQFPDVQVPADGVYGITLEYGDRRNLDYARIAAPEDLHLNPGEKLILTIPKKLQKGLQRRHADTPERMKQIELHFGVITFGDGTGFVAERPRAQRPKQTVTTLKLLAGPGMCSW